MQTLETIYEKAMFVRLFEEAVAALFDAGKVPGLVHLCSGAELVEASICGCLEGPRDQVTGSHRSHGLALLMGANPNAVAAEIMGLQSGLSGGRAGTQHLIAPEVGFLASNGIVGAQVPIAAGAALSAKVGATGGVAVAFYGDGAANQGAVFETLNMAVALSLPLLFVMENNGLAQTTTADAASGGISFMDRAAGFGLRCYAMDGFDATNCLSVATEAISYVREKSKPAFIEAKVARLSGHYHGADAIEEEDAVAFLGYQLEDEKAVAIAGKAKADVAAVFENLGGGA